METVSPVNGVAMVMMIVVMHRMKIQPSAAKSHVKLMNSNVKTPARVYQVNGNVTKWLTALIDQMRNVSMFLIRCMVIISINWESFDGFSLIFHDKF